jgi:hypothetical protein
MWRAAAGAVGSFLNSLAMKMQIVVRERRGTSRLVRARRPAHHPPPGVPAVSLSPNRDAHRDFCRFRDAVRRGSIANTYLIFYTAYAIFFDVL